MNDFLRKIKTLSQSHLILLAAQQQKEIERLESEKSLPAKENSIAIIGMGCRYPGNCNSPEEYWSLLDNGVDAVTQFDRNRWGGGAYSSEDREALESLDQLHGGILEGLDQFDAEFFGITPREAVLMDPSQRVCLEVAWETVEHAGYSVKKLKNQMVGVYLGVCSNDYVHQRQAISDLELYSASGAAISVNSGRLSYFFGWHGPSISIDTACSSSLVAIHTASQALLSNDCDFALAGGVNLIISPLATLSLTRGMFLSPDGRCKTFDKDANGFVRSEGCGMVMLRRLDDAIRENDKILAVIKGSAIHQDGRSQGLMAPNGPSQEAVIRQALKSAGVPAGSINYVEAHGTGTVLGDSIEINALNRVYGPSFTPESPLIVGAVKTNLGHMEVASGVAGLMKLVLGLRHEKIPAHINFNELSPQLGLSQDQKENRIQIPVKGTSWPVRDVPRRGGLSSFGFSGTNVHLIVEEAPPTDRIQQTPAECREALMLSARSNRALSDLVRRYVKFLNHQPTEKLSDICYSAAVGKTHFEYRLAVQGKDIEEIKAGLESFLSSEENIVASNTKRCIDAPSVAFLFTGQGAQYIGMGRELYQSQPVFKQALDQCSEILAEHMDKPLLSIMWDENNGNSIEETQYTQPAMFSLGYSLAKLLMDWGITPKVMLGHSVGEYVAACVAGVFSLREGLKLIATRGRLMATLCESGKMVSVHASRAEVEPFLISYEDKVSIAAENADRQVVISGKSDAIDDIVKSLGVANLEYQSLTVSHGFHSPMMEPMLPAMREAIDLVDLRVPKIPLISNLQGKTGGDVFTKAEYWTEHLRETVEFKSSLQSLYNLKCDLIIEIGPKPVLLGLARNAFENTLIDNDAASAYLPKMLSCLQRNKSEYATTLSLLASCYEAGVDINWERFYLNRHSIKVDLPTYPFQRERFWLDGTKNLNGSSGLRGGHNSSDYHPVLGCKLRLPLSDEIRYEMLYSKEYPEYLSEHQLFDRVVVPGATYLALLMSAIEDNADLNEYSIGSLVFEQPLVLSEGENRYIQVLLRPEGTSVNFGFQIVSFDSNMAGGTQNNIVHCSGQLYPQNDLSYMSAKLPVSLDVAKRTWQEISNGKEDLYNERSERGYNFGHGFQWLAEGWQNGNEVLRKLQMPNAKLPDGEFLLSPGLIDGSLQIAGDYFSGSALETTKEGYIVVPFAIEKFNYRLSTHKNDANGHGNEKTINDIFWCYAKRRSETCDEAERSGKSGSVVCDVFLFNVELQLVLEVRGFEVRKVHQSRIVSQQKESLVKWMYKPTWKQQVLCTSNHRVDYLPDLATMARLLKEDEFEPISYDRLDEFAGISSHLESMTEKYVLEYFHQRCLFEKINARFSKQDLHEKYSLIPEYTRLFERLLEIVEAGGFVRSDDDGWQVIRIPDRQNLKEENAKLVHAYPMIATELELLERCGTALNVVLTGAQSGLELLFPGGSLEETRRLYDNSALAAVLNALAKKAMMIAVRDLPNGRRLRILEVGAGTGATTSHLLDVLPKDKVTYTYTDISAHFTQQAKSTFRDYSFIDYRVLDIERDPVQQGFELGSYDIVVAANVLHATKSMRETMTHVRELLAPGGLLLLIEGVNKLGFLDVTFGLTEGWWRFTDLEIRGNYPLISSALWRELLDKLGYAEFSEINGEMNLPQSIMLARTRQDFPQTTPDYAETENWNWLILNDESNMGKRLAKKMAERGESSILVSHGELYQPISNTEYIIDPEEHEDFRNLFVRIQRQKLQLRGVINFWPVDSIDVTDLNTNNIAASQTLGCRSTLYLINAMIAHNQEKPPRLVLVTRGAHAVIEGDRVSGLCQSTVWGMSKVIDLEHPQFNCLRIDLDGKLANDESASDVDIQIDQIVSELISDKSREDQVAFRSIEGELYRYIGRLNHYTDYPFEKVPSISEKTAAKTLSADACYLITGGLAGLGLLFANWMADRGAKNIILLGRSKADEYALRAIQKLRGRDINVVVRNLDISSFDQMEALMAEIDSTLPPLKGIVHSAGQLDDGIIEQQSWKRFQTTMDAKVQGSWNLHTLTKERELEFFILFSSMTALLGNKGQVNHAAANAFQDALAWYRRSLDLPGMSINWGAWSEIGAAARGNVVERVIALGGGEIKPARGVEAFELLFDLPSEASEGQIGVMPMTWTPEVVGYYDEKGACFLQDVKKSNRGAKNSSKARIGSGLQSELLQKLRTVQFPEREKLMRTFLREVVGAISNNPNIDDTLPLLDMGVDSLMVMEVRTQLKKGLGLADIPISMLMDGLTLENIAKQLCAKLVHTDTFGESKWNSAMIVADRQVGEVLEGRI